MITSLIYSWFVVMYIGVDDGKTIVLLDNCPSDSCSTTRTMINYELDYEPEVRVGDRVFIKEIMECQGEQDDGRPRLLLCDTALFRSTQDTAKPDTGRNR